MIKALFSILSPYAAAFKIVAIVLATWTLASVYFGNQYKTQLSDLSNEYAQYKEDVWQANTQAMYDMDNLHTQQQHQNEAIDNDYWNEKLDYEERIDRLLEHASSDAGGLYVKPLKATRTTDCANVQTAARASPITHAVTRIKLGAKDTEHILETARYSDQTSLMLSALQRYVRDVCLAQPQAQGGKDNGRE